MSTLIAAGKAADGRRPIWPPIWQKTSIKFMHFAGPVVLARGLNPIPFRIRPLNPSAPMVLRLKTRESRSLPTLPNAWTTRDIFFFDAPLRARLASPALIGRGQTVRSRVRARSSGVPPAHGAGWSSLVARQAHNLKVVGSNPTPATILTYGNITRNKPAISAGFFFVLDLT